MKFYLFLLCFLSSSSSMAVGEDDLTKTVITAKPVIPHIFLDTQRPASSRATSLQYSSGPSSLSLNPRPNSWSCSSLPSLSPRSPSSGLCSTPLSPTSWGHRRSPRLEDFPQLLKNESKISLLSPWGKLDSVQFKKDLPLPACSSSSNSLLACSSDPGDDRPDFTIKSEEDFKGVLSSPFKETIQHLKINFIPTVDLLHQILENLSSLNYLYFNFHLGKKISGLNKPSLMLVSRKYLTLSKQDAIDLSPDIIPQLLHRNEEALQLIRTKANEEVQAAQYILGQIYENHQIILEEIKGENETNALLWYKQAIGNAGAQYNLGRYYLTRANAEAGTPRIRGWKEEAFRLFTLAAEQVHRKAQFRLAEDYLNGRVSESALVKEKWEDEAFRLFKSSAKQGYTKAQAYLGWMYARKNMSKAVLWLKKAADKGHLGAQYNLAMIYKDPRIQYIAQISQSERMQEAFRLLKIVEKRNLKEAYLPLGDLYYENQGVPSEIPTSERMNEAWRWFQLAEEEGETEAKFKLGLMRLCEQKVEDEIAKKWFFREIDPLFYIWFIHKYPQGVGESPRENDKKAIGWLQEAIQEYVAPRYRKQYWQLSTMQFALGWMYMHDRVEDGQSKAEHDAIAVDLLSKAASQELREAQFSLGKMYWEGRVADEKSPENDLVAFDLFNRAAEKDIVEALFYLGEMHWEGRVEGGLSIANRKKAIELYSQATEKEFKEAENKLKTILGLPT